MHSLLEPLLAQGHESFLHGFVGQRLLVAHALDFGGDGFEGWVGGGCQIVVVEHASVGFGDELAGGSVEEEMVEPIERSGALGGVVDPICVCSVQGLFAGVVRRVTGIDGFGVAPEGELTVDDWVLGSQVGFVEVVRVLHVAASLPGLECNGGVRADEHGHAAGTASWTGVALLVQSDVARADNGVAAIPGG